MSTITFIQWLTVGIIGSMGLLYLWLTLGIIAHGIKKLVKRKPRLPTWKKRNAFDKTYGLDYKGFEVMRMTEDEWERARASLAQLAEYGFSLDAWEKRHLKEMLDKTNAISERLAKAEAHQRVQEQMLESIKQNYLRSFPISTDELKPDGFARLAEAFKKLAATLPEYAKTPAQPKHPTGLEQGKIYVRQATHGPVLYRITSEGELEVEIRADLLAEKWAKMNKAVYPYVKQLYDKGEIVQVALSCT
jgi:hypothetical protein